jgi:hypothetical protein
VWWCQGSGDKLKNPSAPSIISIIRPLAGSSIIEIPAEDIIRISSPDAQEMLVKIIEPLLKNGVQIESVSINPPTLEEVFLTVIRNEKT